MKPSASQQVIHLPTVSTDRFKKFLTTRAQSSADSRRAASAATKAKRDADRAEALSKTQKISMDALAAEWLEESGASQETRVYFLEHLLPTVIMSLEKVLKEAEKLDVVDASPEDIVGRMNPVNVLAQHLMRNNPKYSLTRQTSPYMQALHKIREGLKKEVFAESETNANKVLEDARKRRDILTSAMHKQRQNHIQTLLADMPTLAFAMPNWGSGGIGGGDDSGGGGVSSATLLEGLKTFVVPGASNVESKSTLFPELPDLSKVSALNTDTNNDNINNNSGTNSDNTTNNDNDSDNVATTVVPDVLVGDSLIEHLHEWTASMRAMPSGKEFEKHLADYLTTWFDSQVDNGALYAMKQRISLLFNDIDITHENTVDESLVMLALGRFESSATVSITGEAQMLQHQNFSCVPESDNTVQEDFDLGSIFLDDDDTDSPSRNNTPINSANVSRLGLLLSQRSVRSGILKRADFERTIIDTVGIDPSEKDWNKLSTLVIDQLAANRDVCLRKYRKEIEKREREKLLLEAFHQIDVDLTGRIDAVELSPVIEKWKGLSEAEALKYTQQLMELSGPEDDTGRISLSQIGFVEFFEMNFLENATHDAALVSIKAFMTITLELHPHTDRSTSRALLLHQLEDVALCCIDDEELYTTTMMCVSKDFEGTPAAKFSMYIALAVNVIDGVVSKLKVVATTTTCTLSIGQLVDCTDEKRTMTGSVVRCGYVIMSNNNTATSGVDFIGTIVDVKNVSAAMIPLTDPLNTHVRHGMVGVIGVGIPNEAEETAAIVKHQYRFCNGVARTLSRGLRQVRLRKALLTVAFEASLFIKRIARVIVSASWYIVVENDHGVEMFETARDGKTDFVSKRTERTLQSAHLFTSAELCKVSSIRSGNYRETAFPVVDLSGKTFLLCIVKTQTRQRLDKEMERDIAKIVRCLGNSQEVLEQGDISPPVTKQTSKNIDWHTARLASDASDTVPNVTFMRLRLIDFRKEFLHTSGYVYENLRYLINLYPSILDIVSMVLIAFAGVEKIDECRNWKFCQACCTPELARSVCDYDPTHEKHNLAIDYIEKGLAKIPRHSLYKHDIQPLVVTFFDWLEVCVACSKHARQSYNKVHEHKTENENETKNEHNNENHNEIETINENENETETDVTVAADAAVVDVVDDVAVVDAAVDDGAVVEDGAIVDDDGRGSGVVVDADVVDADVTGTDTVPADDNVTDGAVADVNAVVGDERVTKSTTNDDNHTINDDSTTPENEQTDPITNVEDNNNDTINEDNTNDTTNEDTTSDSTNQDNANDTDVANDEDNDATSNEATTN